MVEVHPLTITKEQLDGAPADERLTYLMAGNLANDIYILQKLLVASSNTAYNLGAPHDGPANATSLLLAKLLAGRLYEAWNWLRSGANGRLRRRLAQDKGSEAWIRYVELRAYFERGNLVDALRQKIGFHADVETMQEGYGLLAEQPFVELIAEARGNSFYQSAETTALGALCHLAGEDDVARALTRIADEVARIAGLFSDLAHEVIVRFCIEALDVDPDTHLAEAVEVDAPRLVDVRLPYFTDDRPEDGEALHA